MELRGNVRSRSGAALGLWGDHSLLLLPQFRVKRCDAELRHIRHEILVKVDEMLLGTICVSICGNLWILLSVFADHYVFVLVKIWEDDYRAA